MGCKRLLLLLGLVVILSVSSLAQQPFLGEIDLVAFNFAPRGWAMCNGQLLSIQQNAALFSLLGTTYGGDGIQTFALPDLRGRRAISSGQGAGLQNYTLGQLGGEETVSLTISQMPAHSHPFLASGAPGTALSPTGNYWGAASGVNLYSTTGGTVSMAGSAIGSTGGGQPHDNMPPYLVLNYVIALEGIFPSRS